MAMEFIASKHAWAQRKMREERLSGKRRGSDKPGSVF